MKKTFKAGILIVFLFPIFVTLGYADSLKSESKVTGVTIYPNSALVTRTANIDLSAGEHSIISADIIPQVDENTLSVSGMGTAKVKIFGAEIKREYLKQPADERVKELQSKIESLDDQINHENSKLTAFDEEKEFLKSVKLFSGQQLPKDLVTKMPTTNDLQGLEEFLSKQFQAVEGKKEDVNLKVRDLRKQKEALERELIETRGSEGKEKRSIVVDLECAAAGKLVLDISYLVYDVNWFPVYDARVTFDKNEVELASFGIIAQSTGEDWNNTDLIISTAKPSIGGRMPELEPWYLRPFVPPPVVTRENKKMAFDAMQNMARGSALYGIAEKLDESSDYAMEKAKAQQRSEVAYAQAESKGTAVTYKITKSVDIKSDGTAHRVPISAQNLAANFQYAVTPKLSMYAYLKTEVVNSKDGQLLPGRVNIFLDGNYVGISNIAKAIGSEEKFDLYLGVDEGITVKRALIEEKSDDTFVANIPSSNKTIHYVYKLSMENYKTKKIGIDVFDQIPASQDDKIHVKNVKYSIAPTEENVKGKSGVMRWHFDLDPKAKKEITYSFTVEHPRNLEVSGL